MNYKEEYKNNIESYMGIVKENDVFEEKTYAYKKNKFKNKFKNDYLDEDYRKRKKRIKERNWS